MREEAKAGDSSVEQNLSESYKSGKEAERGFPSQIGEKEKAEIEKSNKEIETLKANFLKGHKYIESIGIVPAQASKILEREYEISEADSKRGLIHILTIIPEVQFKNIAKIRLDLIEGAKKINPKFWVHVLTPVDIWNLGLDSKFDVAEAFAMSYPIFDKAFLGGIRVAQIHKSLVLRKFEKYVTSYVIGGSVVRGEATKTSDVDVFIVIDDTDVKRMSRLELRDKLRNIIYSYIQEAEAASGVKNKLSPQIYLLTEFWEAVKDAQPVMFTFIRDGIPLYDRGAFLPWKSLLRMGKIKPSPESIDMFMSSGNKLKEIVDRRIFDIAVLDLYYGILNPTQGLLMLMGQAPANPRDTVKSFEETFVEKEKLVEKKYADILREIVMDYFKAYEHGKIKPGDVTGKDLDRLIKNSLDYIARLKDLREQIEKRIQEKSVGEFYKEVFGLLGSLLKEKSEEKIISEFENQFVGEGKISRRLLDNLKFVVKVKNEVGKKISEKNKSKNKDNLTFKQSKAVDDARKFAAEIINVITEYTQRQDFLNMDRAKYTLEGRDFNADVFFLDNTFIVSSGKVQKVSGRKIVDSNPEELKNQLEKRKDGMVKIDFSALEFLNEAFGDFDLKY